MNVNKLIAVSLLSVAVAMPASITLAQTGAGGPGDVTSTPANAPSGQPAAKKNTTAKKHRTSKKHAKTTSHPKTAQTHEKSNVPAPAPAPAPQQQ